MVAFSDLPRGKYESALNEALSTVTSQLVQICEGIQTKNATLYVHLKKHLHTVRSAMNGENQQPICRDLLSESDLSPAHIETEILVSALRKFLQNLNCDALPRSRRTLCLHLDGDNFDWDWICSEPESAARESRLCRLLITRNVDQIVHQLQRTKELASFRGSIEDRLYMSVELDNQNDLVCFFVANS